MDKAAKPLTREALVSMQVINSDGKLVGKVKDIVFEIGKTSVSLLVENDNGESQTFQWDQIQAASDFIILKPLTQNAKIEKAQPQQEAQIASQVQVKKSSSEAVCPSCGKALTWIPQYSRWYCYNEKKYVNPSQSNEKEGWEQVFPEEQTGQAKAKKQSSEQLCPSCGKDLTWIPQYSRWYCYNEKKYV